MERLFVTSNSSVLGEEDLPDNVLRNIAELQTEYISTQHQTEDNGSEQQIKNPYSLPNEDGTFQKPTLKELLEAEEKRIILEKYHDLRSSYKIAKELGISQSQAYQKIKKYTSGN